MPLDSTHYQGPGGAWFVTIEASVMQAVAFAGYSERVSWPRRVGPFASRAEAERAVSGAKVLEGPYWSGFDE